MWYNIIYVLSGHGVNSNIYAVQTVKQMELYL